MSLNRLSILNRVFLVLVIILSTFSLNALSVENNLLFKNISLTTAKELAAKEGKNVFVEFYADWCVPCKWMEETTLSDDEVQRYLSDHYISVRVDIDDFDGFALKEHYQVRVLPTILILDEKGRALERKEQSMTAPMLLSLLKTQSSSIHSLPVNSSPKDLSGKIENTNGSLINVVSPENHIAEAAIVETTSYRVQVGVFTDYANTKRMVDQVREVCSEPIVVLNDYISNKTVFKVVVGDFEHRDLAASFKNQLMENYGIEGYVK